jgi:hypothetical protein
MNHTWTRLVLALALLGTPAAAQEKAPEKGETAAARKAMTPLKVQILLSKFKGETKVASLPYTLPCNADDRSMLTPMRNESLRMGIEVPVPTTTKEGLPTTQYKNVGTNIDCHASSVEGGRFRLEMTIEHSSIYSPTEEPARAPTGTPLFRTFRTGFVPILRDGQSMQYTVATDPVSGEVVKVDVTVAVIK